MSASTPEAVALSKAIFRAWQQQWCRDMGLPEYEQPELIAAYARALTEQQQEIADLRGDLGRKRILIEHLERLLAASRTPDA